MRINQISIGVDFGNREVLSRIRGSQEGAFSFKSRRKIKWASFL
jgi:hypothetical protein